MKVSTQKPARFAVGDRVTEVKTFADHCIRSSHPDFEKITRMIHNRREGCVVGFLTKKNSRRQENTYALVVWDKLETPAPQSVYMLRQMEPHVMATAWR